MSTSFHEWAAADTDPTSGGSAYEVLVSAGGFRGMGEGGTIAAPAAIANALADALAPLGAEIFELRSGGTRV